MITLINHVLLFFMALYAVIIVIDFIASPRATKRCAIEGTTLLGVFVLLNRTTGFPTPKGAFGGLSQIWAIVIMLICVLCGMMAQYFFYRRKFTWRAFLKPFCVSPIILFPLIGTIQGILEFETIQLISFGLLSFQNGFFWKELFEKVQREKKLQEDIKKKEVEDAKKEATHEKP